MNSASEFLVFPDIIMDSIRISLLVFFGISLIYIIEISLFMGNVFKHFKRKPYENFIPIYNHFILLKLIKIPEFYGLLMFVPLANILLITKTNKGLCKYFDKNSSYIWGVMFVPFVYMIKLDSNFGKNKKSKSVKVETPEIEEYSMKDLDVNLLTDKELDDLNKQKVEESEIDSIFKADIDMLEKAAPYKAGKQKVAVVEDDSFEKETVKRVETVKARDIRNEGKFIREEDVIEKLDL